MSAKTRRGHGMGAPAKICAGLVVLCYGLTGAESRTLDSSGDEPAAVTASGPVVQAAAAATQNALRAGATSVYWGDTHLHTVFSTDGYVAGPTGIQPEQAYRYARGIPVIHPTVKTRVRIKRPLDFLVVADHSDFAGLQVMLARDEPGLVNNEVGRRLRDLFRANQGSIMGLTRGGGAVPIEQMRETYNRVRAVPWLETVAAAERNTIPGRFTALAGWEFSPTPNGRNLHRVVFSSAPPEKLRKFSPFSNQDSERPEDLWAWLQKQASELDTDFVAIPHNSNMSDGLMFQPVDSDGRPMSADYSKTRARWETVVEVTQAKGTSEAHPTFSPSDEFANFEIYSGRFGVQAKPQEADFTRYALMRGMKIEQDVGVNPFKFGLVGGTDIHVGVSGSSEEETFYGATAANLLPEERAKIRTGNFAPWGLSSSGLTAAWATENSREAIFAAFKRKETYATSGPRIQLRMFAGFNFQAADAGAPDIARIGYARGVPMGGDLTNAPGGRAPRLLIHAVKDPIGANLDRLQVVKGWLDGQGQVHEKIFNVAWSGARRLDAKGSLPPVGDTVDLRTATYANTIGQPQLAVVWTDPEFNPNQRSFYYVRALEIPTPRHQVYDAVALGMSPEEIRKLEQPPTIQERAYSSPVWYTPARR